MSLAGTFVKEADRKVRWRMCLWLFSRVWWSCLCSTRTRIAQIESPKLQQLA